MITGFAILLSLSVAFILIGIAIKSKAAPIVRDRSLLHHPDPDVRGGFVTATIYSVWLGQGLIFVGIIGIIVGIFALLQGPPHPPHQ